MATTEIYSSTKTQPELCMECGDFPCTCGHQYESMTKNGLLSLIETLAKLAKKEHNVDVSCKVDDLDLITYLAGHDPKVKTLFRDDEYKAFPSDWKALIRKNADKGVHALLQAIADFPNYQFDAPSSLAMMTAYLAYGPDVVCKSLSNYSDVYRSTPSLDAIYPKLKDILSYKSVLTLRSALFDLKGQCNLDIESVSKDPTSSKLDVRVAVETMKCFQRSVDFLISVFEGIHNRNYKRMCRALEAFLINTTNPGYFEDKTNVNLSDYTEYDGYILYMTLDDLMNVADADTSLSEIICNATKDLPDCTLPLI